nr:membrane glycoprotein [Phlebovirus sp.]
MKKILIILALIGACSCRVRIATGSSRGITEICFSNKIDGDLLSRWWIIEYNKLTNNELFCKFHNVTEYSRTSELNAVLVIKHLLEVSEMTVFDCTDEMRTQNIIITNDAIESRGVPAIIDCSTSEIVRVIDHIDEFITNTKGIPSEDMDRLKAELESTKAQKDNEIAILREELARLKNEVRVKIIKEKEEMRVNHTNEVMTIRQDLDHKVVSLKRELESLERAKVDSSRTIKELKQRISDLVANTSVKQADIEDSLGKLNDLRLQNLELQEMIKIGKLQIAELKKELGEYKLYRREVSSSTESSPETSATPAEIAVTPPAPRRMLNTLQSHYDLGMETNNCPHVRNRPGWGTYVARGMVDLGCTPITYSPTCAGFEMLLDLKRYPFFNAHMHHFTTLEYTIESTLKYSDTGYCELTDENSKKPECHKELSMMKAVCPEKVRGAHFLDLSGKVSGIVCPPDHELSKDCLFCRKVKNSIPLNISLNLQDVVCQRGPAGYHGYIPPLKGVCQVGTKIFKECKHYTSSYETMPFIILYERGKQYVEKLQLKNIEEHDPTSFLCYKHTGVLKNGEVEKDSRHYIKVNATNCKAVNNAKSEKCTGDSVFCSSYNCNSDFPDNYCVVAPGGGPIEVFIAGSWIRPVCLGYEKVLVKRESVVQSIGGEQSCRSCIAECNEDSIKIKSNGFKIHSAVACSHGSCSSKTQEPSTEIDIPYPGLSASTGGSIGIHLSHDDPSLSFHITANCPARDVCDVHNCYICVSGMINYQCHSVLTGIVAATMIVMMILMILMIIKLTISLLKKAPSTVLLPGKWLCLLFCWVIKKMKLKFSHHVHAINNQIGWNGDAPEEVVIREEAPAAPPRRILMPVRYSTYMAIMVTLFTVAAGCTENMLASSKLSKCRIDGGKTKCVLTGNILLKAGPIGSESCLTIRGINDDQKKFISIKTLSSELSCREGQSYWTTQYAPHCISSRRCHLVAECTGNRCQAWNDSIVSSEFSGVHDNSIMQENRCFEQCGGIGCQCFNVNPSCLFVHTTLRAPRKEAFRVFNCIDWVHKLRLEIESPNVHKRIITLSDMNTHLSDWGSITLGLDAEGIKGSNSFSFMRSSSGSFALIDEAFSEIPRKGFIGEIRCSSEAAAASAHSSCKRAPDLINYRPMTDSVECTTSLIDPFSVFFRGSLPQTRNGMTFTTSIDKTGVQALSSGSVQAEFSLSFEGYEVEFDTKSVNCEATFLNASGCYSCNEGAQICFRVDADEGTVFSAQSEDSSESMIGTVPAHKSDFCRILHYNKPTLNEDWTYHCSGDPRPIKIKGTLIAMNPFDDRNKDGETSIIINPKAGEWSISSWFKGLSNWFGGPLKTIGLILLYLMIGAIVLFLLFIIIRTIITSCLKQFFKKMD